MPVDTLRAAVRVHAEAHGYRATADAVGMSLGGLHAFVEGTTPHEKTIRKLQAWFVVTADERGEELTAELVRTAVGMLVRHLPDERREDAVQGMLADLRKRTEAAKVKPPGWLR